MKSDVFKLDGTIEATENALDKVESFGGYFGFDVKDSAFSRLLAEEGINSLSTLLGVNEGTLWVETIDKDFEIHIKTSTQLSPDKRDSLIDLSKAKKFTPKKGILGKISQFINFVATDMASGDNPFMFTNSSDEMISYTAMMVSSDVAYWSMKKEEEKSEMADVERSIIERFADDIVVSVALKNIEIIIKKTKK